MDVSKQIVGTDDIANEAVTNEKLGGGITESKLAEKMMLVRPDIASKSTSNTSWVTIDEWTLASYLFQYSKPVAFEVVPVPGQIASIANPSAQAKFRFMRGPNEIAQFGIQGTNPPSFFRAVDTIGVKLTSYDYTFQFATSNASYSTIITQCRLIAYHV